MSVIGGRRKDAYVPRRRPKTTVDRLVESLENLEKISGSLSEVDLRTTSGDLRQLIKNSREKSKELAELLTAAVKADVPRNPLAAPNTEPRQVEAQPA